MIDIRRTVLWVIFAFSLVLLWDKWQIHNGNKPLFAPSPAVTPAVTDPEARQCQRPPLWQRRRFWYVACQHRQHADQCLGAGCEWPGP